MRGPKGRGNPSPARPGLVRACGIQTVTWTLSLRSGKENGSPHQRARRFAMRLFFGDFLYDSLFPAVAGEQDDLLTLCFRLQHIYGSFQAVIVEAYQRVIEDQRRIRCQFLRHRQSQ